MVKNNVLPVLFADDTSFIISNSNLRDMTHDVGVVLDLIQKWYNANILLLNYDKTAIMHFSSDMDYRPLDTTHSISNKINSSDSLKFLGVIFESSLTWGNILT